MKSSYVWLDDCSGNVWYSELIDYNSLTALFLAFDDSERSEELLRLSVVIY